MPCTAECTTSTRSCVETNVSILKNYQCLCWGLHFSYQCAAYAVVINVKLSIININCCYGGLEEWEWVNSWDKLLSVRECSTGSIHGNMTWICSKFTFLVHWGLGKFKCLWRILLPKFPSSEDAKLWNFMCWLVILGVTISQWQQHILPVIVLQNRKISLLYIWLTC